MVCRCKWAGFSSNSASISACNGHSPVSSADAIPARSRSSSRLAGLRRDHAAGARPARAVPSVGHRGLHRNGVRLDEIDFHQRQVLALHARAPPRNRRAGTAARVASFRRDFVRDHGNHAAPAERRSSGNGDRVVAREHRKSSGTCCITLAICEILPDASFTPTMFSICGSRASVAGSTLTPVRPCTLYTMIGRRIGRGDGLVVLVEPFLRGLVVVRRDGQDAVRRPCARASRASSITSACCSRRRRPAPAPCPRPLPA